MAQHPFPVDPALTSVTLAYKNNSYIADDILPRVPVAREEFKYRKFDKEAYLTIPETRVGRKGKPSQVELSFTEVTASTQDYGLEDAVPYSDIQNAPENWNPEQKAVEFLTELIALAREKRAADLVFNEDTYSSGLKTTLSGTSQFSHASSNPISTLKTAIDALFLRPNVMVMGREVFSCLSTHSKIVQCVYPNANGNGIVTPEQLATILDIERVVVGSAWLNSARPGATPSIARCWGKHVALLHVNKAAGTSDLPTFGLTAELGTRSAGTSFDFDIGVRGGNKVRVWEQVCELAVAPDLGYFIKNAIA